MTYHVRPATAVDASAVARIHVRAWQQAYAGIIPENILTGLSIQERTVRWAAIAERGDEHGVMRVAEVEDDVIGFSLVETGADGRCELGALYVDPGHWGRGVGHRLHRAAVHDMTAGDREEAVLWVVERNTRARSFYDRHDWRPDGESLDEIWGDVVVRVIRLKRVWTSANVTR